MSKSPSKMSYCNPRRASLLAAFLVLFTAVPSLAQGRKVSKTPRALAILEFDDKGKVHITPVTILINGDFYDASAYKAAPVPMALQPETVYEGVRTGVSQGLFKITRARKIFNTWSGEGNWDPNTPKAPAAKRKALNPEEEIEKPPVLRRAGSTPAKTSETAKPDEKTTPPPATKPSSPDDSGSTITLGSNRITAKPPVEPDERPVLRRGQPERAVAPDMTDTKVPSAWTVVTTIPAISDETLADPRSFHYLMKGPEEEDIRKKMLALATVDVIKRASTLSAEVPGEIKQAKPAAAKIQPQFEDVKFDAYDPSSNNEPVFVLTAKAHARTSGRVFDYSVLLVARQDIYADLHVAFSKISDAAHMDSQPRFDLIDVVDADGDGYGEMLFRRTYSTGHAFSVYRVIGNQLWPLFEGMAQ